MIDSDGYRANVAIVLTNENRQVFWAGRAGRRGWQFPQGGVEKDETPLAAMYRELEEEIGLREDDVELLGQTSDWLRYDLPERYRRSRSYPVCVGQKQLWYLLRLNSDIDAICFDTGDKPEFDRWCWVDFWYPLRKVIFFKRQVYRQALEELGNHLFDGNPPPKRGSKRRSRITRVELC
ncbi:MAG: RNA pyrophosphohydrolase [Gammaproteobacteria bacterium]|nr:RNA pyrophosphohydrolase [Gammaproteobacteria bacterium]NNF61080.1 RNA pyrophosphohydrolase [Gammaproteobacteria bacterium]NNM21407.1 RNA pyrophosphohydrolase [Gammaproteobacteria bacterium]